MQEEITRLVQGLDDSALRFIEPVSATNVKPATRPRSAPVHAAPGGQFTVRKMSGT